MKKNDVPKIVALGGGTGLSTMLRGLKKFTPDLTAVVTVADDGGGSGVLRQDLGMLPPGDIRNCIVALAQTEPLMTKLLQYRFDEGCLAGQCFGNLFLAAMYGISKNFEQAVQRVSDVLRVTGRVLPVTVDDVHIEAELESGEIVIGESKISRALSDGKGRIKTVRLVPSDAEPLGDALREIEQADIIVLGPGSLYTSIIPNLIVRGVADAVMKSGALKIYVCNIMTQPGETDGMTAHQHAAAICGHAGGKVMDYCIANRQEIPQELLDKYFEDGAEAVEVSRTKFALDHIKLTEGDYLRIEEGGRLRHDCDKLAQAILGVYHARRRGNKPRGQFGMFSFAKNH